MNDYEELMQAAEPLRRYLEAHCGLTIEGLVSRDRVDILHGEMGLPFEAARQGPGNRIYDAVFCSHPYKQVEE